MNSLNTEDIERFMDAEARQYAKYAGISVEEAREMMSTVDPANSYRHEIKDSWDGNNKGCLLIVMPLPALALGYVLLHMITRLL